MFAFLSVHQRNYNIFAVQYLIFELTSKKYYNEISCHPTVVIISTDELAESFFFVVESFF